MAAARYLTTEEFAALMKVEPQTVKDWRRKRIGPRFFRSAPTRKATVRYRESDIEAWIESNLVETST